TQSLFLRRGGSVSGTASGATHRLGRPPVRQSGTATAGTKIPVLQAALSAHLAFRLHVCAARRFSRRQTRLSLLPPAVSIRVHDRYQDGRTAPAPVGTRRGRSSGHAPVENRSTRTAYGMMLLVILPCAVLMGLAAMFFSEPVLTLQDDGGKADVIVVPGGDGPPRAVEAARLWKEGRSPVIRVTGDGDCLPSTRL